KAEYEVEARVFGIGGLVEKTAAQNVLDGWHSRAKFINGWLARQPARAGARLRGCAAVSIRGMSSPGPHRRLRAILLVASLVLASCGGTETAPSRAKPNREAEPASEPAASDEPGDAVPVIASDEPEFDFGTVSPSGSVTHVFKLVNRGSADLKIE